MWTDHLISTIEGMGVQVIGRSSARSTNETLKLTFSDGSTIEVAFNANIDHDNGESEAHAMAAGGASEVRSVWGNLIRPLHDQAILEAVDTDL
jgi:hypothetical protein